ncbi:Lin0512 family protein [Oceanidesulfovibrio indonesiensis]|uniref:Lin0512 family protein n=1 Tax=Oceanidesulfovibrio indonesiensis TaxID=54767 RepID=UPI001ABF2E7C|nr:Lin0512 family protein [Oceanidesulfovibrio indonesiensis]
MPRKRFAIELGYAADMHGEDMTKAAVRAVRDAISRTCLCGIVEIWGRNQFQGVYVHADVAVPVPERVDTEELLAAIPIGEKSVSVIAGGMSVAGIEVPCFGPGTSNIIVACAALTVSVDTDAMEHSGGASRDGACGCAT